MSDDESLVPKKEVPDKLDEAFEKEKPNASITVVIQPPPPPTVTYEDAQKMVAGALAIDEKVEEIKTKKKDRKTRGKRERALLGIVERAFWFTVGAFVVATVLTILNGRDILHIDTKVLLAMFGIGALPPVLTFLVNVFGKDKDS